jgi:hypothetical protein
VLHPNQFQVNEAWIAFRLNDEPIHTESDGDFDFLALVDAASGFILGSEPIPTELAEPTPVEAMRLLEQGQARAKQWPRTIFVPTELRAKFLAAEAERLGICVVRVSQDQLVFFVAEPRESFRQRFGSDGTQ